MVSRGGRPDLAKSYLKKLSAPTLLIVGEEDTEVISLNQQALEQIPDGKLVLVPSATHLFEEPGTLEEVMTLATGWFAAKLDEDKASVPNNEPPILTEIKKVLHPVQSEQAWDDLIERISGSRIVMLGEASHGTAEFYNVRRAISERLIKEHGFSFIAVEGDWPDCQKLHDYIQADPTLEPKLNAEEIMQQFHRWPTWMWANDEVATLIEWMRSFRAGFHGLDVYS